MRVWKLKDEYRDVNNLDPQDFVAVEMGDKVLFIQESGTYDLASVECGLPTADMWDLIVGGDE